MHQRRNLAMAIRLPIERHKFIRNKLKKVPEFAQKYLFQPFDTFITTIGSLDASNPLALH